MESIVIGRFKGSRWGGGVRREGEHAPYPKFSLFQSQLLPNFEIIIHENGKCFATNSTPLRLRFFSVWMWEKGAEEWEGRDENVCVCLSVVY